jgi:hypothetical protein
MKSIILFIIYLLASNSGFSQKSFNKKFEMSKGTWIMPFKRITCIEDNEKRKHMSVNMFDSTLRFVTDSAYEVRAVHDAEVTTVFEVEGEYCVVTRYGDYIIRYQRLSKPTIKKGAFIKAGQRIGSLLNLTESQYSLELSLNFNGKELDARKWFDWQNAASTGLPKAWLH